MFKECRHILSSGRRCHAAALRGKDWCYFHEKLHRLVHPRTGEHVGPTAMPLIEDDSSLKLALASVIASLNSPYAANSLYRDPRRAGLMLYALQIVSQVIARSQKNVETETVREVSSDENGLELAPEKIVCEPGIDCARCRHQDECSNYEDQDQDEERDFEADEDEEQQDGTTDDSEPDQRDSQEDEDSEDEDSEDSEDAEDEDSEHGEDSEAEDSEDEDSEDEESEDEDSEDDEDSEEVKLLHTALRILQHDSQSRKRPKSFAPKAPASRDTGPATSPPAA